MKGNCPLESGILQVEHKRGWISQAGCDYSNQELLWKGFCRDCSVVVPSGCGVHLLLSLVGKAVTRPCAIGVGISPMSSWKTDFNRWNLSQEYEPDSNRQQSSEISYEYPSRYSDRYPGEGRILPMGSFHRKFSTMPGGYRNTFQTLGARFCGDLSFACFCSRLRRACLLFTSWHVEWRRL